MAIIWTIGSANEKETNFFLALQSVHFKTIPIASIKSMIQILFAKILPCPTAIIICSDCTISEIDFYVFSKNQQYLLSGAPVFISDFNSHVRVKSPQIENVLALQSKTQGCVQQVQNFRIAIENFKNFNSGLGLGSEKVGCVETNRGLDASAFRTDLENVTLGFSPKEQILFDLLLQNIDTCIPRSQILNVIWPNMKISARNLDSHISRLRCKIAIT
ncbi:MAG: helix-turn-helix domain-containing protein, partial [Proteobacteria bacterium]|nr:helix-turn-helix domain-containing protein [Pseudomonadota bacterium]